MIGGENSDTSYTADCLLSRSWSKVALCESKWNQLGMCPIPLDITSVISIRQVGVISCAHPHAQHGQRPHEFGAAAMQI